MRSRSIKDIYSDNTEYQLHLNNREMTVRAKYCRRDAQYTRYAFTDVNTGESIYYIEVHSPHLYDFSDFGKDKKCTLIVNFNCEVNHEIILPLNSHSYIVNPSQQTKIKGRYHAVSANIFTSLNARSNQGLAPAGGRASLASDQNISANNNNNKRGRDYERGRDYNREKMSRPNQEHTSQNRRYQPEYREEHRTFQQIESRRRTDSLPRDATIVSFTLDYCEQHRDRLEDIRIIEDYFHQSYDYTSEETIGNSIQYFLIHLEKNKKSLINSNYNFNTLSIFLSNLIKYYIRELQRKDYRKTAKEERYIATIINKLGKVQLENPLLNLKLFTDNIISDLIAILLRLEVSSQSIANTLWGLDSIAHENIKLLSKITPHDISLFIKLLANNKVCSRQNISNAFRALGNLFEEGLSYLLTEISPNDINKLFVKLVKWDGAALPIKGNDAIQEINNFLWALGTLAKFESAKLLTEISPQKFKLLLDKMLLGKGRARDYSNFLCTLGEMAVRGYTRPLDDFTAEHIRRLTDKILESEESIPQDVSSALLGYSTLAASGKHAHLIDKIYASDIKRLLDLLIKDSTASAQNMSIVMHALGKLLEKGYAPLLIDISSEHIEVLFNRLLNNNPTATTISYAIWALGKITEFGFSHLLERVTASHIKNLLDKFAKYNAASRDISNVLWALGRIADTDSMLLARISATDIKILIDQLLKQDNQAIETSLSMWALGKLADNNHSHLLSEISSLQIKQMFEYLINNNPNALDIGNFIWALGKIAEFGPAHLLERVDTCNIEILLEKLLKNKQALEDKQSLPVSNTLWGIAKLLEGGHKLSISSNSLQHLFMLIKKGILHSIKYGATFRGLFLLYQLLPQISSIGQHLDWQSLSTQLIEKYLQIESNLMNLRRTKDTGAHLRLTVFRIEKIEYISELIKKLNPSLTLDSYSAIIAFIKDLFEFKLNFKQFHRLAKILADLKSILPEKLDEQYAAVVAQCKDNLKTLPELLQTEILAILPRIQHAEIQDSVADLGEVHDVAGDVSSIPSIDAVPAENMNTTSSPTLLETNTDTNQSAVASNRDINNNNIQPNRQIVSHDEIFVQEEAENIITNHSPSITVADSGKIKVTLSKRDIPFFNPKKEEDIQRLEEYVNRFAQKKFTYDRETNKKYTKFDLIIAPIYLLGNQLGVWAAVDMPVSNVTFGIYAGIRRSLEDEGDDRAYNFGINNGKAGEEYEDIETIEALEFGDWTRCMNHSPTNTVSAKQKKIAGNKNISFSPNRNIQAGQQLTINYGPRYFEDLDFNPFYIHHTDNWESPAERYQKHEQYYAAGLYRFDDKTNTDLQLTPGTYVLPKAMKWILDNDVGALSRALEKGMSPELLSYAYADGEFLPPYQQQHLTPLIYACYLGRKECIEALLKHGADPDRCLLVKGWQALTVLVKHADITLVESIGIKLLNEMHFCAVDDSEYLNLLHFAIKRGSTKLVNELLKRATMYGYDLFMHAFNRPKKSPPFYGINSCIIDGNFEMLSIILDRAQFNGRFFEEIESGNLFNQETFVATSLENLLKLQTLLSHKKWRSIFSKNGVLADLEKAIDDKKAQQVISINQAETVLNQGETETTVVNLNSENVSSNEFATTKPATQSTEISTSHEEETTYIENDRYPVAPGKRPKTSKSTDENSTEESSTDEEVIKQTARKSVYVYAYNSSDESESDKEQPKKAARKSVYVRDINSDESESDEEETYNTTPAGKKRKMVVGDSESETDKENTDTETESDTETKGVMLFYGKGKRKKMVVGDSESEPDTENRDTDTATETKKLKKAKSIFNSSSGPAKQPPKNDESIFTKRK